MGPLKDSRHAPATNLIESDVSWSVPYHAFKKGMYVVENNAVSKDSISMKKIIDRAKMNQVNRSTNSSTMMYSKKLSLRRIPTNMYIDEDIKTTELRKYIP